MEGLPSQTIWYFEYITPELIQAEGVRGVVYEGDTAYQHVQVLDTGPFGRSLVLDGKTQSSESDEWVYHEALVQPVMLAHGNPRRVLVAGGGEGATIREVLRHRSVEQVVMVDLDKEVVDLCKEHLVNHHQGAFEDPRLTLLHEDARAYLRDSTEPFDVIIIDVPDPLEGGPAYLLYTEEFYNLVAERLGPGGLMVAQSGPVGPINVHEVFTAISTTLDRVFARSYGYRIYMPSFGTTWGFLTGSRDDGPELLSLTPAEIDRRIEERLTSELAYYDGVTHQGLLALPKYVRKAMAEDARVITDDNPLYAI